VFQTLFKIALRGIARNWRQSFTALLAIATSFISLTLFQGYMDDVQKMYQESNIKREMMGHLIIEKNDHKKSLTREDQDFILQKLKKQSEVDSVVRILPISGTILNGKSSMVFVGIGLDVAEGLKMRAPNWKWNVLAGEPLTKEDQGLLVGHKLANILGCSPDPIPDFVQGLGGFSAKVRPLKCPVPLLQLNAVTKHGQMNSMNLELTGITDAIYKELDERFVVLPLQTAQTLFDTDEAGYITVKLKDEKNIKSFRDRMQTILASQGDLTIVRWQDHRLGDLYNRTMDLLTIFRNFVVSVILVICSLSVFNTILRNISERSREIGTLRSMGFEPLHINVLFGLEAITLAIVSCVIGVLVSEFLELTINLIGLTYKPGVFSSPVPFTIYVAPLLHVQTAAFLSVLVVLTTLFSVRRFQRLKISECLGHV
jgi:putative ABC transport system permease protein